MIRESMVQEAQLALAAYRGGDMPRYQVHQTNARLLADHLALQEARNQPPRPPQFRPDFGIEGPDHPHDDFLKQDNALSGLARYVVRPITVGALFGAAAYFLGRAVGLF